MPITVKIPAQLRPATGGEGEIEIAEAATVGDALDAVFDEHDGLRERITEDGEVYNVIFRFMARFFFGYTATIEGYLRDLGHRFGELTVIEP